MCILDSSSSRHLSQMGSAVKPNLKRCLFRWQCPVSSPTTHLNWSLFSLNRSFVLLAEGPSRNAYEGALCQIRLYWPNPIFRLLGSMSHCSLLKAVRLGQPNSVSPFPSFLRVVLCDVLLPLDRFLHGDHPPTAPTAPSLRALVLSDSLLMCQSIQMYHNYPLF
jgi:hypothetical protein